jgi:hypothetical protein
MRLHFLKLEQHDIDVLYKISCHKHMCFLQVQPSMEMTNELT